MKTSQVAQTQYERNEIVACVLADNSGDLGGRLTAIKWLRSQYGLQFDVAKMIVKDIQERKPWVRYAKTF